MKKILLATHNAGKVHEFQSLLAGLKWHITSQADFAIPSIEETGLTFVENALLKARHGSQQSGMPALADDSGLVVDALNGAPGIYSARYAGENAKADAHIAKLLSNLQDIPEEKRTARFYCVLVYLRHALDPTPVIAEGTWEGKILVAPQGKNGFGYDPIFFVPEYNCTAAEFSAAEKNRISHRGKAVKSLLEKF